jgi:hypothetical protein
MKTSIEIEIKNHILDLINGGVLTNDNKDDWHFHAFNVDFYIVYHYNAVKWLEKHEIDAFEAIEMVQEYERDNFGETNTAINPEAVVNTLAYIYGEEVLSNIDAETVEQLKELLQSELV